MSQVSLVPGDSLTDNDTFVPGALDVNKQQVTAVQGQCKAQTMCRWICGLRTAGPVSWIRSQLQKLPR